MEESLYAEYPEAYDALYARKDYDAEVRFVLSQFEARRADSNESSQQRALIVGCGTGEHSKRLHEAGFEVVGVDKYEAMVERARTKSDAEFHVATLPNLPVDGPFDLVWLPFTVIQHLDPTTLAASLRTVADRLAEGGMLVFDQINTGEEGTGPRLRNHPTDGGTYARLTHVHQEGDNEYRWDSLVFTPDGEFFTDTHRLFDHTHDYLAGICAVLGLTLERHGWYDEDADPGDDGLVVFVAA